LRSSVSRAPPRTNDMGRGAGRPLCKPEGRHGRDAIENSNSLGSFGHCLMIAFTAVTRRYDSDGRRVLRRYRWQLSCARCRKRPELGPGSRRRDRRRCDHLYSGWCAESCRGERLFVAATGYVTFAEIAPDPKDYPGALPNMLKADAMVFAPPSARSTCATHTSGGHSSSAPRAVRTYVLRITAAATGLPRVIQSLWIHRRAMWASAALFARGRRRNERC
jgi:hypothetical protein